MNEHIAKTADCKTCAADIEYMAGIRDPYWRHVGGSYNHAAKPAEETVQAR